MALSSLWFKARIQSLRFVREINPYNKYMGKKIPSSIIIERLLFQQVRNLFISPNPSKEPPSPSSLISTRMCLGAGRGQGEGKILLIIIKNLGVIYQWLIYKLF
jgi:hypothetical protein